MRRLLIGIILIACTASPALATGRVDESCYSNSSSTEANYIVCQHSHSSMRSCLNGYASDFSETASSCVAAAQAHYDVGSSYEGFNADLEFGIAAQQLLDAAEANIFLFRHDLATSQIQTATTILNSIQSDSQAGDLAGKATSLLSRAHHLTQLAGTLH